jgi:ParB family chromosome partitioning protein
MQVLLDDIIIKDRVRREIGDLKPLMESMRLHGQLNPVTLSRENELIAGHRRTLAARELGWKFIEAHIVDRATEIEKLQLELEENVHRKDFSPEELLAGFKRLDKLMHPSLSRRIGTAVRSFFGRLFRKRKRYHASDNQDARNNQTQHTAPSATTMSSPQDTTGKQETDVIGSQFGI